MNNSKPAESMMDIRVSPAVVVVVLVLVAAILVALYFLIIARAPGKSQPVEPGGVAAPQMPAEGGKTAPQTPGMAKDEPLSEKANSQSGAPPVEQPSSQPKGEQPSAEAPAKAQPSETTKSP